MISVHDETLLTDIDLTTALARLLSSRKLRAQFEADAQRLAKSLSVCAEDVAAFVSLSSDQLEDQAECLLSKRFYEVRQVLPWTIPGLGDRAKSLFWEYAEGAWPEGHRRHLEDALQFCDFLCAHPQGAVNRYEWNCLRFLSSRRRFFIELTRDFLVDGRPRTAIQVLYRGRNGRPQDHAWRLW